jgi:hypothetical protein
MERRASWASRGTNVVSGEDIGEELVRVARQLHAARRKADRHRGELVAIVKQAREYGIPLATIGALTKFSDAAILKMTRE